MILTVANGLDDQLKNNLTTIITVANLQSHFFKKNDKCRTP